MTEQEQRIAIAEACGWKWYRRPATGPWADKPMRAMYHPLLVPDYVDTLKVADLTERQCNEVFLWREGNIPDYLHDLNAMHEAEKTLRHPCEESYTYVRHLEQICGWVPWQATAAQRAEAFLRTLGRWKDAEPYPSNSGSSGTA
jgi:hypothetical protein